MQKTLLLFAIILGVALVCLLGMCGYLWVASAVADQAYATERDTLNTTKTTASSWENARAQGQQIAAQVVDHQASWSWSEQLPVMVAELSGMVKDSGTTLDTLQPLPVVRASRSRVSRCTSPRIRI